MSEFTFAIPIGSIDQRHAARRDEDGTAVTACGLTRQIAARNPILLDVTETTCEECLKAMGWQVGVIKDFFGPGKDLPVKGPKEMFERYGGKRA